MTDIREAMEKAGIQPLATGDVRIIPNTVLKWTVEPDEDGTHRCVVLGKYTDLQDDAWPMAWVVPCTCSPMYADGTHEVPIPPGESGFTKKCVYAVTYLGGAVHKDDLGDYKGTVSTPTLDQIKAAVAESLGLI